MRNQVILIPLSMAAFQLFNYRMALEHVLDAWHWLCGAAVLFGTYFLFILGPRSLVSEGPALWIAWTLPRGMEELLKAKARLWSMLASGLVFGAADCGRAVPRGLVAGGFGRVGVVFIQL